MLACTLPADAQKNSIGELLDEYRYAEMDTAKAYSLYDIGLYYNDRKIDSALYYYKLCDGWIERCIRRDPEVIHRAKFQTVHCAIYGRLGKAHFRLGQSNLAIDRYKQGLMLAMQYKDTLMMGDLFNGLANIYDRTGNHGKAVEYCRKGLKLLEKTNHYETLIASYHNLALLYMKQGNLKQARAYLQLSLEKAEEHEYALGVGVVKRALAMYYDRTKKLDSALVLINESIEALKGSTSPVRLSDAYTMLAKIQLDREDPQAALAAAMKSYKISEQTNHLAGITHASQYVSQAYEILGNDQQALIYLKQARKYAEKVDKQRNVTETLERNMRLKAAEETTADSIAHAQQMKIYQDRLAIQQEKVRENSIAFYALLAGIGVLIVLAAGILLSIRYKKRAETILKAQSERARELQKNTLESINYAQRIQNAILPKVDEMKAHFDDAFVLWQPRETVGGVISLFEHSGDRSIVLLLDTQTEGVPGALLSVLSSTIGKRAFQSARAGTALKIWEQVRQDLESQITNFNLSRENLLVVDINHASMSIEAAGNGVHLSVPTTSGTNQLLDPNNTDVLSVTHTLSKGSTIHLASRGVLPLLHTISEVPGSLQEQEALLKDTLDAVLVDRDIMIIGLQI